jgi:cytochrome c-type biogenesis protein CcmE
MKSRVRFVVAICLAVGLAGWLGFTSLKGNQERYASPGQLSAGGTYRLNGTVAPGAPSDASARAQSPDGLRFRVLGKGDSSQSVEVVYRGSVPDTFRAGREIVVTGRLEDGVFQARRNSMVTLCPSKFQAKGDRPDDPA